MHCKICDSETTLVFTADIRGKYKAGYFRCGSCGFMQTEEPYWISEAYDSAINEIDLGPVNRALSGSKIVEGVILSMFDKEAKFIDYGAGYGLLVRLMRDLGFDFYWYDKYCDNIFTKHFVANHETRFRTIDSLRSLRTSRRPTL